MSENHELQKLPPRRRSKKINIAPAAKWERILSEIHKEEVPVTVLQSIIVHLKDGTTVTIDIAELLSEGHTPESIEDLIGTRLSGLQNIIRDVDYHINVDRVAKTIQPITNSLLKNI